MSHIANGLNGASGTWSRDAVSSLAPAESRTRVDKTIEIIAIVVLGVATIGVAWCGYQSMQWTAASSQHAETASQKHIAAAALFGLVTQKISYDGAISAQYAKAVSDGKSGVADFYRDALVRKDMLPILDAWQADLLRGAAGLHDDLRGVTSFRGTQCRATGAVRGCRCRRRGRHSR